MEQMHPLLKADQIKSNMRTVLTDEGIVFKERFINKLSKLYISGIDDVLEGREPHSEMYWVEVLRSI
jgi:hypothetical protein